MANPNKAYLYRGPRISVESREVTFYNEDEVRAEMKAKYPAPAYEVRKVNRRFGSKYVTYMVAYKN